VIAVNTKVKNSVTFVDMAMNHPWLYSRREFNMAWTVITTVMPFIPIQSIDKLMYKYPDIFVGRKAKGTYGDTEVPILAVLTFLPSQTLKSRG